MNPRKSVPYLHLHFFRWSHFVHFFPRFCLIVDSISFFSFLNYSVDGIWITKQMDLNRSRIYARIKIEFSKFWCKQQQKTLNLWKILSATKTEMHNEKNTWHSIEFNASWLHTLYGIAFENKILMWNLHIYIFIFLFILMFFRHVLVYEQTCCSNLKWYEWP